MCEALLNLIRILSEACEVFAPFLAQRLGENVLDRQVGGLEVDLLGVGEALFESFEDDLPLLAATAEVERPCPNGFVEQLVARPVAALP